MSFEGRAGKTISKTLTNHHFRVLPPFFSKFFRFFSLPFVNSFVQRNYHPIHVGDYA